MVQLIRVAGIGVFLFAMVLGAEAQVAAPTPTPTVKQDFDADTSGDDILILANITAKELRFDTVPNVKVEFPGTQKRANIWVTQRQNLPEQVEAGKTYRNVGLQLRISTRFADIEQILRDALRDSGASGSVNCQPVEPVAAAPQPASSTEIAEQKPRPKKPRRRGSK